MSNKRIIAITGGIGSGKSVVSAIVQTMGFPVYDCDTQARTIMDSDEAMRHRIAREVTPDALNPDGSLNRRQLSSHVFSNPQALKTLNAIVHGAVIDDIRRWVDAQQSSVVWIESAIIYESGIDLLADEVWEVTAPREVRLGRVMRRNNATREEVLSRIKSQERTATEIAYRHNSVITLVNDNVVPLLPQILKSLSNLFRTHGSA